MRTALERNMNKNRTEGTIYGQNTMARTTKHKTVHAERNTPRFISSGQGMDRSCFFTPQHPSPPHTPDLPPSPLVAAQMRIACVICCTAQSVSSWSPGVALQNSTSLPHSCRGELRSCWPTPCRPEGVRSTIRLHRESRSQPEDRALEQPIRALSVGTFPQ